MSALNPYLRAWSPVVAAALIAGWIGGSAPSPSRLLAGVFTDHAVVQRGLPVAVWGRADAGERVLVSLGPATTQATADGYGRWRAELPALEAGGPYDLTARTSDGEVSKASDVLVGDVFLCSGQSNMVLQVSRTTMGRFEAMRATDGRLRMATVPNVDSPTPLEDLAEPLAWEVASPETVPDWSGACYYFARDLREGPLAGDDVPVGLVTAAWGGSGIRSWMSEAGVASVGGYGSDLDLLRQYTDDRAAAQQAFGARWQAWWVDRTGVDPSAAPWQPDAGAEWPAAPKDLGDWTRWDGLGGFTGMVWFRATFRLTAGQAAQDATLALGAVDEVDQTWMNGNVVGNTFGYGTERTYPIPSGRLRAGENVLVVNVLNTWASGGLTGDHAVRALRLADGTRVELEDWRYVPVRDVPGTPPRAPWESVGGLTTIHNAMVAPLGPYGLRGVLWYQGESNTGDGAEYADLLAGLMRGWRIQFGRPGEAALPVLVVQLPNFGPWRTEPGESGWAEVREAQRIATERDPHAALAVTIDVGDPRDLHPPNKQAVGARLARAARRLVYGEPVSPTGPLATRATRAGNEVVVTFSDVDGTLVAFGGAGPPGFEVCGEAAGTCRYADARAAGSEVRVRIGDDGPASRVRYAWADSPIVTLYDGSGLPAGPFELEVEEAR